MEIQALIASRLEDLADRVEILYHEGNFAEAKLLRDEGLMLAECYDSEGTFLYINDLTQIQ
jgi:hypothetical protein